ncbi:MAG: peptide deformylase [Halanaerobium sp.]|nr:peptide deformylase [Halanaerobium sp.]
MAIKEILQLGNPSLYLKARPCRREELGQLQKVVKDLHDTLLDFRARRGAGRAIAAPQIGIRKRLLYMYIDKPLALINPELVFPDDEMMEVWDDCMSFPGLLVRVQRYRRCRVRFFNLDWQEEVMDIHDDLAELIQHEYDHLEGILAVSRAIDGKSFSLLSQKRFLNI